IRKPSSGSVISPTPDRPWLAERPLVDVPVDRGALDVASEALRLPVYRRAIELAHPAVNGLPKVHRIAREVFADECHHLSEVVAVFAYVQGRVRGGEEPIVFGADPARAVAAGP